jgi:glutamate synthase domain-containing protein 1
MTAMPTRQGLYDPAREHDSCGMGFVAHPRGHKSHGFITDGLKVLGNLDHRGGVGADPLLGDGAGCMIQIPDGLLRDWASNQSMPLPEAGSYAVAMCFLPRADTARDEGIRHFERIVAMEGQILLGWRDVPVDPEALGQHLHDTMPVIRQAIVARGPRIADQDAFERKLLVIRKQVLNPLARMAEEQGLPGLATFYIASFSSRTLVYKGQVLATALGAFYRDLTNPLTQSALAMVHQRFSTNTFPSWKLAHPFRFISHNGEINTVRGNVNWMNARRRTMESPLLGADLAKMWPLIPHGQSDTASLDNALELLIAGGYPLAHAMMMLVPEAWAGNSEMDSARRNFYEYHAALMEPWDGPAAIAFSDGRQVGAMLDRNGLRPARVTITNDRVILASESGVLDVPESEIVRKWRLEPGRMLLIDLDAGRIVDDHEIKSSLAEAVPYGDWLRDTQIKLEDLPPLDVAEPAVGDLTGRLRLFGYTEEDLKLILSPMARGTDPLGSMGTDTPIAVLSQRPRLLFDYFKQNFAQVTNPAIDPIREAMVMSLVSMIGPTCLVVAPERSSGLRWRNQFFRTANSTRSVRSTMQLMGRFVRQRSTQPGAAVQASCWRLRCSGCAGKQPRQYLATTMCLSCRIVRRGPIASPSRSHWPQARSITSLSAKGFAFRPDWLSRRVKRARSTIFASSPAMARRRSIPTLLMTQSRAWGWGSKPTETIVRLPPRACSRSCRRWAFRPIRAIAARRHSTRSVFRQHSSTSILRVRRPLSRVPGSTPSLRRRPVATLQLITAEPNCSISAARTPFASRARNMPGLPRPLLTCNTQCAAIFLKNI